MIRVNKLLTSFSLYDIKTYIRSLSTNVYFLIHKYFFVINNRTHSEYVY